MTTKTALLTALEKWLPAEIPNLGFNRGQLIQFITKEARRYLKTARKRKSASVSAAANSAMLLCDFINSMGVGIGLDVGLNPKDLISKHLPYADDANFE